MDILQNFIDKYIFDKKTITHLESLLLEDMKNKLVAHKDNSQQPMIVLPYTLIPENIQENTIVIDAGGTNFRSCLVHRNPAKPGEHEITDFVTTKMPGIERLLDKKGFYESIADNIEYLRDKAEHIGFCFSYAMEIAENGDGKVIALGKEVKTEGVNGTYVGKELMEVLKSRGWTKLKSITLVNDAASVLISSCSDIALILGTGINSCFVNHNMEDKSKDHIVVTECGLFNDVNPNVLINEVDKSSTLPGSSLLEKSTGGAYRKELFIHAVTKAIQEDILMCPQGFLDKITPRDIDNLYQNKDSLNTNEVALYRIIDAIDTRAAFITASVLSAAMEFAGDRLASKTRICCNGSTFWKTPFFADKTESFIREITENHYAFEIIRMENDTILGASLVPYMIKN